MGVVVENARKMKAEWSQFPADERGVGGRSSHSVSWVNGAALLLGGEHEARVPIDSNLWSWTHTKPTWQPISMEGPAPSPRVAHAQAVILQEGRSFLYVFGGRAGIHMNEEPLQDMYQFDVDSGVWCQIEAADAPCARSYHQMVGIGSDLYVFGGCSAHGRMNDLYRFDTTKNTWHALPSPNGMDGRGGAIFQASPNGDKLFVIGGFSGEERNDIWMFDLIQENWNQVEPKGEPLRPRSVCSSGALRVGGRNWLVIFGGEVDPSEKGHEGAGDFSNDLILFDCDSFELSTPLLTDAPQPEARGWGSGCADASSNSFLLYGGLSGNDSNPVRLCDTWRIQFYG